MSAETITVTIGRCSRCGELWPLCTCGRPTTHATLDHLEPEPPAGEEHEPTLDEIEGVPMPTLREWVQWRGAGGALSLYHVRLSTSGALLCGRRAPLGAAADSFPPAEKKCAICLGKVAELDRELDS